MFKNSILNVTLVNCEKLHNDLNLTEEQIHFDKRK